MNSESALVPISGFLYDECFFCHFFCQVGGIKSLYLFHNRPAWFQFVTATFCHANWWVPCPPLSLPFSLVFLSFLAFVVHANRTGSFFFLFYFYVGNCFLISSFYNLTNALTCSGNIFLAIFFSYTFLVRLWQSLFYLVCKFSSEWSMNICYFIAFATGKLVEEEGGSFALWLSYILTGVGANLVSWLILPRNTVSVGASGAVFGLFTISVLIKVPGRNCVLKFIVSLFLVVLPSSYSF